MMNLLKYPLAILIIGAIGFLFPKLIGDGPAVYSAAVLIAIFAVMSYGLDIVVSDLGEVSLAHTAFFGVGCYITAALSTILGVSSAWMTLACTIVAAVFFATVIGLITVRLRDFVFSLVTYAVSVVAVQVVENSDLLGRTDGLRGIPVLDLSIGSIRFTAANDQALWPVAFVLLVVTIYCVARFRRSALGVAATMVHLNQRVATASGINPAKVRVQVLMFSAPISAAAGWLYAYQRAYVSADVMGSYFLVLMLTAVVLTGRGRLFGPLIGTSILLIQEKFFALGGNIDKVLLGTILVVVLAFFPGGLMELGRPLQRRLSREG